MIRGTRGAAVPKAFADDDFNCPISLARMTDPVITKYGHAFEREVIA